MGSGHLVDLYHRLAASELTSEYGSAIEMVSHRYIELLLTHLEQASTSRTSRPQTSPLLTGGAKYPKPTPFNGINTNFVPTFSQTSSRAMGNSILLSPFDRVVRPRCYKQTDAEGSAALVLQTSCPHP